jgi:hypothetical protein
MKSLIKKLLRENITNGGLALIKTKDYLVLFDLNNENIIGVVTYEKVDDGLFHVPAIASERGYGYFLYGIVMSLVYPNYIITDRDSSTSEAATSVLRKMYQDPNIERITLGVSDKNYVTFYKNTDEEQFIKNTKFRIKKPINLTHLKNNGDSIKDSINLYDLNEKAFQFFSDKLN